MRLVRGARILQWLEEAPYTDLERGTLQFTPPTKKRQHATGPVQIARMVLHPAPQSGVLEVRSEAMSEGKKYTPAITFEGVEYQEQEQPWSITFKGADNNDYNISPIPLRNQNAKVYCNCLDFYWRFATWNAKANSLMGEPPRPYVRKTNTHPPANEKQTPGLCKHLLRLAQELKQNRIVN